MQQNLSQCTSCGAFTRRSLHYEEEYQSSALFERLRTSNFPANDKEITHIRHTVLPAVSDNISSLEAKLVSLRKVITSMEEERERLINVRKKYTDLISFHRTLPLEIWSEIFLHTRCAYSDFNALDASGSMWLLSHVCQRWQHVALSLQSFWSTIHIWFWGVAWREAHVERLEAVLQRSHQGLLDVNLSDAVERDWGQWGETFTFESSTSKRMLHIILAESYRWRKAQLSFSLENWDNVYVPLHNRLPCLELVILNFYDGGSLGLEEQSPISVFKNCSRLTTLTLSGNMSMSRFEFPWDQLTELYLPNLDVRGDAEKCRACVRSIARCPNLEIVTMPFGDQWVDEEEATYSNVLQLNATNVPNTFTLPLLREASLLAYPYAAPSDCLQGFRHLLTRSNCMHSLTSLSLDGVHLAVSPDNTLHSFLSQTRSLTFLKLIIRAVHPYSDQTVAYGQSQIAILVKSLEVIPMRAVTFLPLLSSLDIDLYGHSYPVYIPYFGQIGEFASMLKARWKGDDAVGLARLRTCYFDVHAPEYIYDDVYRELASSVLVHHVFNEEERSIFDSLVDDGMDLAIRITAGEIIRDVVVFAVHR